jgi:hypothetical protein
MSGDTKTFRATATRVLLTQLVVLLGLWLLQSHYSP